MVVPFGESVSAAYVDLLEDTLKGTKLLQVTMVKQPVIAGNVNIDDELHRRFEDFKFSDGRTGYWWIQDRLKALLRQNGEYWTAMRRNGQWSYILHGLKDMLKGKMPRWNANRLFITLFDSAKDLHWSRAPMPPCLVTLDFKPVKDNLSLIADFRSQYADAKAYGNLLSLAYLLIDVCGKTGFKPAELYSVSHKPILKYKVKEAQALLESLRKEEDKWSR